MSKFQCFVLVTLHIVLIIWCHKAYGKLAQQYGSLKTIREIQEMILARKSGETARQLNFRVKRSILDELTNSKGRWIDDIKISRLRKRDAPAGNGSRVICTTLGETCGKIPTFPGMCLRSCLNILDGSDSEPFYRIVPIVTVTTCQSMNTPFPTFPEFLKENKGKINSIKNVLRSFAVQAGSEGEFARAGANALLINMIKLATGDDFDELKPLIAKLEIQDTDEEAAPEKTDGEDQTGTSSPSVGGGENEGNCDESHLEDESHILAAALNKRACLFDLLMPGYFVFNRAPAVASTKLIAGMLRAWNMPLFLFGGVKCCMSRFAQETRIYECLHNYTILEHEHGLPEIARPLSSEVCGIIPQIDGSIHNKLENDTMGEEDEDAVTPAGCQSDSDSSFELVSEEEKDPMDICETNMPTTTVQPDYEKDEEVDAVKEPDVGDYDDNMEGNDDE